MSMHHNVNVDVAVDHGLEASAVLTNLHFWVNLNRANGEHFHDGRYWTYNTQENFLKLFPYLKNRDKVKRVTALLEKEGLIIKGNFNKKGYDRTTWYALTPKAFAYFENVTKKPVNTQCADLPNGAQPNNDANGQICPMDRAKMPNAMGKSARPIPDINTDITTDIKNTCANVSKTDPIQIEFEQLWKIKPDRQGGNPKNTALKNYRARRKAGHSAEVIKNGLIRYTKYCAAKGDLKTEFVKMLSTFLNPDDQFLETWEITPDASNKPSNSGSHGQKQTVAAATRDHYRREAEKANRATDHQSEIEVS